MGLPAWPRPPRLAPPPTPSLTGFPPCAGIALYPGNAQLLSCSHYYHNDIPPLVEPGRPQRVDCVVTEVTYVGPLSSQGQVSLQRASVGRCSDCLLRFLMDRNEPWWSEARLRSEAKRWSSCSSAVTRPERTSAPSAT